MEGHSRYLLDTRGEYHGPFDLVVDASGARSALRAKHGNISYHRAYPFGAVWGVCADEEQRFCTDYLQQRYDGAGVMIGMLAIGKRPLDDKQAATFFWSLPTATYATWREDGLAPWKKRVLDYWPELAPFLDQFGSVDDLTFAQYSDTILKHWHDDRMVFIGDAAHCTSPQLGQGANLGLLDALSLALCLRETPEDINAALRCHSKARKSHVHFYQFASRWLTPFFQSDSKAAAWLRNRSFNSMGKIPLVKPQMLYTLAGLKNGLFTHLDPGQWHPRYALKPRLPQA